MEPKADEFYIGWQPEAPLGVSRRVRHFIFAVCLIVPAVGALLVLNQRGFASSSFEFGQPSVLEGVLVKQPVPFLAVHRGRDADGQPVFQNILLVGKGKFGAGGMLADFEKKQGPLEGKTVKLEGYLIYHDGRSLLEIEELLEVKAPVLGAPSPVVTASLGTGAFMGEVADPKCLFGVMKPGHGKPHRSCAARCIAGGIPPVLKTIAANGRTQYFLLADGENGALNEEVLPYVGGPVMVCGELRQVGDWLVLFKDREKALSRLPKNLNITVPMCGG